MKFQLSTMLHSPDTETKPVSSRHHWLRLVIILLLAGNTALHYLTSAHLLPYHTVYRSLYFLPITMAAVVWGVRGGLITSLIATLVHLPYLLWFEARTATALIDNLLEIALFNAAALLIGALAEASHRERHQALTMRAYLDGILASLPIGVITRTPDGPLVPQNQAGEQLLGSSSQDLLLPGVGGYHERDWLGKPLGIYRTQLYTPDQTVIGEVMTLEDLSTQRALTEKIAQAERQAALGQLAGGLAHEVRNPLGIVRATTQLLATRLAEQRDVAQYCRVLTTEVDRIDRLISEVLNYAQPREIVLAEINPVVFLTTLVESCQPYAEQAGVTLFVQPCSTPLPLVADAELLRQVALNLVLNAIQASSAGSKIELACHANTDGVCLMVRDHGSGIPPHLRGRVFDPFFTTREDGSGMGLSVVARIVADHHGSISLEDAPGGGTLARLCLPYRKGVSS